VLADPTTVTLKIYDGSRTLLTTVPQASLTNVSVGVWQYDYTIPAGTEGTIYYEFGGDLAATPAIGRAGVPVTWV